MPDAVAIGAVSADESVDVLGEEKVVVELLPEERKTKIFAAFKTLLERNTRGDFGANGMPATRRLEDLCGFEVTNKERDVMWNEFSKPAE